MQTVRLEYLTRNGWVVGHQDVPLLDPERYVERLTANGKFGRATDLSSGQVWVSPDVPTDPSILVSSGTHIPKLPDGKCDFCGGPHDTGGCLL